MGIERLRFQENVGLGIGMLYSQKNVGLRIGRLNFRKEDLEIEKTVQSGFAKAADQEHSGQDLMTW